MASAAIAKIQLKAQKQYKPGQRIECVTACELKRTAFRLSSRGYGVAIIGLNDIEDHVLTITEAPEN